MLSLAEALAALPTAADDVAAHLHAKGIRGVRRSSCGCPLAAYLTSLGMGDPVVGVTGISARVNGRRQRVSAPPRALVYFILSFDRGAEWPELVLDDTAEANDV